MLTLNNLMNHLRCINLNRWPLVAEDIESFYGIDGHQETTELIINACGWKILTSLFKEEYILNKKERTWKRTQARFDEMWTSLVKPDEENVRKATATWIKVISIFEDLAKRLDHTFILDNLKTNKRVFSRDGVSIEDQVDVFVASPKNKTLIMFNPTVPSNVSTKGIRFRNMMAINYLMAEDLTPDTILEYSWKANHCSKDYFFNEINVTPQIIEYTRNLNLMLLQPNETKRANIALCTTCSRASSCTFTMLKNKGKLCRQDN